MGQKFMTREISHAVISLFLFLVFATILVRCDQVNASQAFIDDPRPVATIKVGPPSPEEDVTDFIEQSLRVFDPILDFFRNLLREQQDIHA